MNIGQAAAASGVSAKMIRYYESIALIPPGKRTEAGARYFGCRRYHDLTYASSREAHEGDAMPGRIAADLGVSLRFVKRARSLGFSLEQIRELLSLWQNKQRASADVKSIALGHVAELNQRIAELSEMRDTLQTLASCCHGDARPECPILHSLAG